MRSHLEAVYRQTGRMPLKLAEVPELPVELTYLWLWFCELDVARGNNGYSFVPLSNTEIQAWSLLTRNEPLPWEIMVIRRIDTVRIRVANEK